MYDVFMGSQTIIAQRIEDLLRQRDWSAADLSRASGVDQSTISNILSGRRKQIRSETLSKIANGFETSTDYLNGITNDPASSNAPPLPEYAAGVLELMRKLDRGRNYELYVIAQGFAAASEDINRIAKQEFMDLLLDSADELAGEEDADRVMQMLQHLEEKWTSSRLLLGSNKPQEPRQD